MAFIRSDRLNTMWTAFAKWFANMWTAFAKWFASAIRHLVAVLKKQPTKNSPVTENWFAASILVTLVAWALAHYLLVYRILPYGKTTLIFYESASDERQLTLKKAMPQISYDNETGDDGTPFLAIVLPRNENAFYVSGLGYTNHWPALFSDKYRDTDATENDASCFYRNWHFDSHALREFSRMPPLSVKKIPRLEMTGIPIYRISIPPGIVPPKWALQIFLECALDKRAASLSLTDFGLEIINPPFPMPERGQAQYPFTVRTDRLVHATNLRAIGNYDYATSLNGYTLNPGDDMTLTWTDSSQQELKELLLVVLGVIAGVAATCFIEGIKTIA